MNTPKPERPAAMPGRAPRTLPTRDLLPARRKLRRGALTLKVTIPARAVPLFRALVQATEAASPRRFAAWCLCKGLTSEEAVGQFDRLLNDLL